MNPTAHPIAFVVFLALLAGAIATFAWLMRERVAMLRAAQPSPRLDRWGERWAGVLTYFVGQKRILTRRYRAAGLMHALIFWGFLAVALNTVQFVGGGFSHGFRVPGFAPGTVLGEGYVLVRDLFEIAVLAMVVAAVARRLFVRPQRLTLSWDAIAILGMIGLLMVTDLAMAGIETASTGTAGGYRSVAGRALAPVFEGLSAGGAGLAHAAAWWLHLIALLAFLTYLPISKHFHVVTSLPSVLFRRLDRGSLPTPDLENSERFGVTGFKDLRWKDVLDVYSCTECGRCQ